MMQFFRGPRELYNVKAHGAGIYFATDTKEIIQNGLSFLGELPADLAAAIARIEANEGAIEVLNGVGEGSVSKQINDAIDNFANKLTDDGTVNTFKELVEYAAENAGDLGALILRVDNTEAKNAEQDLLILSIQEDLETFKGEVSMKFESNNAEIQQSIDNQITNAFTWENVQ